MIVLRRETTDDDRRRIISSYLSGQNPKTISQVLDIKLGAVYATISVYKNEGRQTKKRRGGVQHKKLSIEHKETIRGWVDEDCSITLNRLRQRCEQDLALNVSETTIGRCLRSFHYTIKRVSLIPERRNSSDVINQRAEYANVFMRLLAMIDDRNLFFIDEVGFCVSMRQKQGRAPRGFRAVQMVGNLRTRNISVFSAINNRGLFYFKVQTCPFNTSCFLSAITEMVSKLSDQGVERAFFILDNVAFHKAQSVREFVCGAGHELLFLPPYSPFLNPIENAFSHWKNHVRAGKPIDEEGLLRLIDNGSLLIDEHNCSAYYRHMIGFIPRCLNREEIIDE
jgi:transposase